ncbi:methyltransferase-like protein 27 [Watersipora subatra]|uniref:methyltransferase-like protein 27 n=1 Tax=Watersipora subatra TaxID=2589382 RepID=UPI00355BEDCB
MSETKVDWEQILRVGTSIEGTERVAYYDANADVYDHDMAASEYSGPRETAQLLHKYLQGQVDANILDIAGGTGLVAKELKELAPYCNVDGLDAATDMLELAKQRGLYRKIFAQYFSMETNIPSNSYDAVSCCGGFIPGHVPSETTAKMVDLVKPGGYVIILMRLSFAETDPDLLKLRPLVHQLVETRNIDLIEEAEARWSAWPVFYRLVASQPDVLLAGLRAGPVFSDLGPAGPVQVSLSSVVMNRPLGLGTAGWR